MKCICSIPPESVVVVRDLCSEYSSALTAFSDTVVAKSDELRKTIEKVGGPVLELDDEDWAVTRTTISSMGNSKLTTLFGELFWTTEDAVAMAKAMGTCLEPASRSLAHWLVVQTGRGRGFVLLAK